MSDFVPKLYLKSDCPFCFKLVMFLTETQQLQDVEIIRIEGTDDAAMNQHRQLLEQLTGTKASFPTVELSPNHYVSDSDALVQHFADKVGVDPKQAQGYQYYLGNLFPAYIARFRELKALREKLAE